MLTNIGFSTGALCKGDFCRALQILEGRLEAVELSALRSHEFVELMQKLPTLNLAPFGYVSLHAPKEIDEGVISALARVNLPVVVHADLVTPGKILSLAGLGDRLLIENTDSRCTTGKHPEELSLLMRELPAARLCLDVGHATQLGIPLEDFLTLRIGQYHVSCVDERCKHQELSDEMLGMLRKFYTVAPRAPVILETPTEEWLGQVEKVRTLL